MSCNNKDKNLNIRVQQELFDEYYELCVENGTTISAQLRGLMINSVKCGKIIDTSVKVARTGTDFRDGIDKLHNIPAQW